MAHPHFTPEQVIDAIKEARGLLSIAAQRLGCHPETVRNYMAEYPEVAKARHEAREMQKDVTESKLLGLIDDADLAAVKYYLSTQAKDRGYVERQEITGADGQPQKHVVEYVNDWRAPTG
jgi:hypothetical protein